MTEDNIGIHELLYLLTSDINRPQVNRLSKNRLGPGKIFFSLQSGTNHEFLAQFVFKLWIE